MVHDVWKQIRPFTAVQKRFTSEVAGDCRVDVQGTVTSNEKLLCLISQLDSAVMVFTANVLTYLPSLKSFFQAEVQTLLLSLCGNTFASQVFAEARWMKHCVGI